MLLSERQVSYMESTALLKLSNINDQYRVRISTFFGGFVARGKLAVELEGESHSLGTEPFLTGPFPTLLEPKDI